MKIVQSFSYAIKGIKNCFISETNFKIHTAFAVVALLLAVFFGVTLQQWMVILFFVGLVMAMEMMNTAIEVLCDVLHPGIHPGIKKVKDIAAGAVLIAACCSLAAGTAIFLPAMVQWMKNI